MTKPKIDHVERPELPWRQPEQALTECGLVAAAYPTISRLELAQRWKEWGQQRTAMTVCMTCFNTAQHWRTWEQDPLHGIERAAKLEPHRWVPPGFQEINPAIASEGSPLRTELRAIAILIERHRDEFNGLVVGLGQVSSLDQQRQKRREEKRRERSMRGKPL